MQGKLPAFQFYPSDWRSDPGIQALSFEDRGIWFEILCLMHESPKRGILLLPNGTPMSSVSLGRILGIPTPKIVKALDRIAGVGVSDRDPESGALVNRRMVRDEHIRQVRTEAGRLGGNPDLLKQKPSKIEPKVETDDKQKPTPSSSSSSSIPPVVPQVTDEPPKEPVEVLAKYTLDFEQFWATYPRRVGKEAAFAAWKKRRFSQRTQDLIMQALLAIRNSAEWTREGGRYIPNPSTWLNQGRWDDEVAQYKAKSASVVQL